MKAVNSNVEKTKSSRKNALLTFTIIICLQFQFGNLLNFPLTIALIGIPFFCRSFFVATFQKSGILILISLLLIPLLNYLFDSEGVNAASFFKAYSLMCFGVSIYVVIFSSKLGNRNLDFLVTGLKYCLFTLLTISLLQFFFGYFRFTLLARPFSQFTNDFQFKPDPGASISRAAGFYIEPSFNALVCLSIFTSLALLPNVKRRKLLLTVCLLYMFVTFSVSGIIVLLLIYGLTEIFRKARNRFGILLLISCTFFVFNYLYRRIAQIAEVGSSGNFRLVSPFNLLKTELPNNPFGLTVGSLRDVMYGAGYLNGKTVGTSLDNGWFLLIYYFGILGIAILFLGLWQSIKVCRKLKKHGEEYWLLGLAPILSLGFTGGIFLPDFLLLFSLMMVSLRMRLTNERISHQTFSLEHRGV